MTGWRKDLAGGLWGEEFLRDLLRCGREELEEVKRFARIARKFGVDHEAILGYVASEFGEYEVEDLIYAAMRLTLEAIAQAVEKEDLEIAERLKEWNVTVRPEAGSKFNIPPLDDPRKVESMEVEDLIREVVEAVRGA